MATKARAVAPARRGRGASAAPARRERPRWYESLLGLVEDQSDEIWGLALVLVAALVALGMYAQLAGPVGRGVREGAADLFGLSRYVVPVGFLALGGYLLSRRPRPQPARVALGLVLALLALSGLIADAGATPSVHQPLRAVRGAGGLAGMLVAVPLRAGLGTWGAGLVLAAVLLVALLVTTATPVRTVGHGVRGTARLGWRGARFAVGTTWRVLRAGSGAGAGASTDWEDGGTGWAGDELGDEEPWAPGEVSAGGAAGEFGWPALAGEEQEPRDGRDGREGRDGRDGREGGKGRAAKRRSAGEVEAAAGSGPRVPLTSPEPLPIGGLASAGKGEQLAIDLGPAPQVRPPWRLPPISLLKRSKAASVDRHQVEVLGQTLQGALAALGVETRLVGATVGPSVTRYELELGPGVKVQRVTALHRDIAYAMAATEVRILAPIPGRSAIGVEVPNRQRQTVTLGDILSSGEAATARHPLEVAAGRDIAGRPVLVNLAEMPHILIAGATGSGKSSCLNAMLTSVLMRATPEQVRLILVDPKRVELGAYAGLPHLLTNVVTNPKRAANALRWAVEEMERRYDLLAEVGMRDITGYNAAYDRGELNDQPGGHSAGGAPAPGGWADREPAPGGWAHREPAGGGPAGGEPAEGDWAEEDWAELHDTTAGHGEDPTVPDGAGALQTQRYERLPFVLVVVDELNDLMMVAARDVEESICRIAQMARAVGIHLVIATQRPSVDVITGLIKANIPSRLAFAVSSLADSRVVLDQAGAERLIGKGDMLLLTASSSSPRRLQGPWVDEEDVRKVVAHWRRQASPAYVEGIEGQEAGPGEASGDPEDNDDLLEAAMELVVRSQLGSTSMLQRKLRVGFARAGRLMDLLEQRGVVGPSEGSKARAVLMTVDELESRGD